MLKCLHFQRKHQTLLSINKPNFIYRTCSCIAKTETAAKSSSCLLTTFALSASSTKSHANIERMSVSAQRALLYPVQLAPSSNMRKTRPSNKPLFKKDGITGSHTAQLHETCMESPLFPSIRVTWQEHVRISYCDLTMCL